MHPPPTPTPSKTSPTALHATLPSAYLPIFLFLPLPLFCTPIRPLFSATPSNRVLFNWWDGLRVSVRVHTRTQTHTIFFFYLLSTLARSSSSSTSSLFHVSARCSPFLDRCFSTQHEFLGIVPSFVTSRGYLPSALVDVDGDNHASGMLETALMAKRRAIPPYRSFSGPFFPVSFLFFSPRVKES